MLIGLLCIHRFLATYAFAAGNYRQLLSFIFHANSHVHTHTHTHTPLTHTIIMTFTYVRVYTPHNLTDVCEAILCLKGVVCHTVFIEVWPVAYAARLICRMIAPSNTHSLGLIAPSLLPAQVLGAFQPSQAVYPAPYVAICSIGCSCTLTKLNNLNVASQVATTHSVVKLGHPDLASYMYTYTLTVCLCVCEAVRVYNRYVTIVAM